MKPRSQLIIYTDLDGTFLDHNTYSCTDSLPALHAVMTRGIPVIFCSSKTRAEIEVIRQHTRVPDPFIIENGGALFVPSGYFPFRLDGSVSRDGFDVIEMGTPYAKLVKTLRRIREDCNCHLLGFHDMTIEQISADCGLTLPEARRAKQREYDEPFKFLGTAEQVPALLKKIEEAGLRYSVGGRYYHLHGVNDKGRAVRLLNDIFRKTCRSIYTVGLGDSLNDLPMLQAVDLPILVRKPDGSHDWSVMERLSNVWPIDGIGPIGWTKAVTQVLAQANSLSHQIHWRDHE
jgi:mannosyl-3-phosphoglycerate phosphatase